MTAWWISGKTTTILGPRLYRIAAGPTLAEVNRSIVHCRRDMDTVDVVTSPEGADLTEQELYALIYALLEEQKATRDIDWI